ncbi:MAG: hypothetical protein U5K43_04050 [Halofilum sp. (in: g-proteobacteria)]|nr:hypothetical protein [Halofilum sp. (in: g-proteobacteria)]
MTRNERRAFWHGHFEAWSGGEESQAAYCRRHGLSPMSFSQWKRRFERERSRRRWMERASGRRWSRWRSPTGRRLARTSGVTVAIDARVWLRLSRDFDAGALQRAVAALSDAGR